MTETAIPAVAAAVGAPFISEVAQSSQSPHFFPLTGADCWWGVLSDLENCVGHFWTFAWNVEDISRSCFSRAHFLFAKLFFFKWWFSSTLLKQVVLDVTNTA